MANQATLVTTYKDPTGTSIIKSEIVEAEDLTSIEVEIPAASTNKEVTIVLAITTLKSICMSCSKKSGENGNFTGLTVKTNSSGSPDDTFTITPSNGLVWSANDPNSNPITVALTKVYVTNAGTAAANFAIRALNDATP